MENINTIKQHVGLIVPLAEEFRILTKIFPILSTDNIDAVDYYHLKCPVSNISLTAIVLGDLGINIASQLSEKLINHINPSIIILIGIAGAIDRDLKLGDVVIANEINEFLASAKTVNKDDAYIFKYSGNHWKTTFSLAQLATNFEFAHKLFYISWTKKAEMSQKELNILPKQCQLFNQIPQILVGHIASGDVVGASKAYTIELQGIERKFLALEMEAAGVAQAAYGRANPVDTMVIRGISDFSDERKHDLDASQNRIWRSYAMYNASNFLFEFIKSIVEGTSASSPITTSKSNRPRKKNLDSDNDKPLPNSSQSNILIYY